MRNLAATLDSDEKVQAAMRALAQKRFVGVRAFLGFVPPESIQAVFRS